MTEGMEAELLPAIAGRSTNDPAHGIGIMQQEPESRCAGCIDIRKLRAEAGYWRSMHTLAKEREAKLRREIDVLDAKLKLRERQLFERKTERGRSKKSGNGPHEENPNRRKRGQQPGSPGHGRRPHKGLPADEVESDLADNEKRCSRCHLPFVEMEGTENSEEWG